VQAGADRRHRHVDHEHVDDAHELAEQQHGQHQPAAAGFLASGSGAHLEFCSGLKLFHARMTNG
jgi:hypothetical protein